jgi:hypothetical protein
MIALWSSFLKKFFWRLMAFAPSACIAFASEDFFERAINLDYLHCLIDASLCTEVMPSRFRGIMAIFALIFIILLIIFYGKTSWKEAKKDVRKDLETHDSRGVWSKYLKGLRDVMNLSEKERLSIYEYHDALNGFLLLAREATSLKYMSAGRSVYNDGIIKAAFHDGESKVNIERSPNSWPYQTRNKSHKDYVEEVIKKSDMDRRTVKRLTMPSCALYAKMIKKTDGSPFGVLLIESESVELEELEQIRKVFEKECLRLTFFAEDYATPKADVLSFEEAAI